MLCTQSSVRGGLQVIGGTSNTLSGARSDILGGKTYLPGKHGLLDASKLGSSNAGRSSVLKDTNATNSSRLSDSSWRVLDFQNVGTQVTSKTSNSAGTNSQPVDGISNQILTVFIEGHEVVVKKKGRGSVKGPKPTLDTRIVVHFNVKMQSIGLLERYILDENKEDAWIEIQVRNTKEEALANVPPEVDLVQWKILVDYWSLKDVQDIAEKNAEHRDHHGPPHRTGRTPFVNLREEISQTISSISFVEIYLPKILNPCLDREGSGKGDVEGDGIVIVMVVAAMVTVMADRRRARREW
ncbi:hypothetical protein ACH5RR_021163 [Cinchona calisaya]|uniref:Uncharacterized protein n=1 Tax=Cinchona calisaya TaxID=153742 RepID=A0ABD2ZHI5_9GENT